MGISHQRMKRRHTLSGGLNDLPFAHQNFAQRHLIGMRFVPDIATLPGEVRQFGYREILAPRTAQCLLPKLAFQHN